MVLLDVRPKQTITSSPNSLSRNGGPVTGVNPDYQVGQLGCPNPSANLVGEAKRCVLVIRLGPAFFCDFKSESGGKFTTFHCVYLYNYGGLLCVNVR